MLSKLISVGLLTLILLAIDVYVFQAVRVVFGDKSFKTWAFGAYWSLVALSIAAIWFYNFYNLPLSSAYWRRAAIMFATLIYFSKVFAVIFIAFDDVLRLLQWFYIKISSMFVSSPKLAEGVAVPQQEGITRSEFLMKTALVAATAPIVVLSFGIISGAHDYRVRRKTIYLPNLPKGFDGIKIGQLSDIHSGSFFNKTAVKGGVELLIQEKPDVVFFTGDLVNNIASEVKDYIDVFGKITAPLGVFSTLGNHDYGDYFVWNSPEEKKRNLQDLKEAHKIMGWDLLMNEHRFLTQNNEKIAVIGIENWGAKGRFPKYGKMAEAYRGTEEAPVKLLLSHDPSHWDAQVRPEYPDIDIMFAGHTHGMQFGIEIGNFRWSPVSLMYDQWADLYQAGNQYLYVNRGFGFIGYPGRVGILPEITIIELKTKV